jgi:hypothetical protein
MRDCRKCGKRKKNVEVDIETGMCSPCFESLEKKVVVHDSRSEGGLRDRT